MTDDSRNDRIRVRAYELWVADGGAPGNDWSYWLQAEADIQKEDSATAKKSPVKKAAAPKKAPAKAATTKTAATKAPAAKTTAKKTPAKTKA